MRAQPTQKGEGVGCVRTVSVTSSRQIFNVLQKLFMFNIKFLVANKLFVLDSGVFRAQLILLYNLYYTN